MAVRIVSADQSGRNAQLTFRAKSQMLANEGTEVFMMPALRDFLHRMGREARQGAIGLVIDDDYLEIGFPLEEAPTPRQPKGKKRK
jgi:hypothetical protein